MNQRLPKILLSLFAFICFVSVLLRIYVASDISTKGEQIRKLEYELDELIKRNKELKGKVALESSLTKVKERALVLGMVDAPKPQFLTTFTTASASGQTGF